MATTQATETLTPGGRPRRRHCSQCHRPFEVAARAQAELPYFSGNWPDPRWFCTDECMWAWTAAARAPEFIARHWRGAQKPGAGDWITDQTLMHAVIDGLLSIDARLQHLIAVVERVATRDTDPRENPPA